jgi:hypothetical protein
MFIVIVMSRGGSMPFFKRDTLVFYDDQNAHVKSIASGWFIEMVFWGMHRDLIGLCIEAGHVLVAGEWGRG